MHHPRNEENRPEPGSEPPNRNITAVLNADYQALQNDLKEAKELARAYQSQLASKSNEFGELKVVLEKASADLAHMHNAVGQLRKERHALANDVNRLMWMEEELKQTKADRDRIQKQLDTFGKALHSAEKVISMSHGEKERHKRAAEDLGNALALSEGTVSTLKAERDELQEELVIVRRALQCTAASVRDLWSKSGRTDEGAVAQASEIPPASEFQPTAKIPPAAETSPTAGTETESIITLRFDGPEPDVVVGNTPGIVRPVRRGHNGDKPA